MIKPILKYISAGSRLIISMASSRYFWYATLGLFITGSLWIALSGRYPMAFDENYHLGLIQLYANGWLPVFGNQPAGADVYGAVARDPSYLYHYLMSFPYRLMQAAGLQLTATIVGLRLINIALFVLGLAVYRRVLISVGASKAMAHTILFLVSILPVSVFLAAQINYDNLFFLISAVAILLAVQVLQDKFNTSRLLLLVLVCTIGCLVKFSFLPIAVVILVYLLFSYILSPDISLKNFIKSFNRMPRVTLFVVSALILLFVGLNLERYGRNLIDYKSPVPDCALVLGAERCKSYGPWNRNNFLLAKAETTPTFDDNIITFSHEWEFSIFRSAFFAINQDYITKEPYIVQMRTAKAVALAGLICFVIWGWRILQANRRLWLLLLAIILYIGALFTRNYTEYQQFETIIAVHGRYLLPIAPLILLFFGLGLKELFRAAGAKPALPVAFLIIGLIIFQGSGASIYIRSSDYYWWWQNQKIVELNEKTQKTLERWTPLDQRLVIPQDKL